MAAANPLPGRLQSDHRGGNGGFAAEDPGNQRLRNDGAGRGRLRKAGAAAFRNLPSGLYAGEGRRIFPGEAKGV